MIVTKFELPVFQPAEFLSIVPNFVLSISTGTETKCGGNTPHKIATQNRHDQHAKEEDERAHRRGDGTQGSV